MICPQFKPIVGGYERSADRLSSAIAKLGNKVVVVTERRSTEMAQIERSNGYTISRLFCIYRPYIHTISSALSLTQFLLNHGRRFHVWHVHQFGISASIAIVLGKVLNRPVLLKLTNSGTKGISSQFGGQLFGTIGKYLHQRIDACISISDETSLEAIKFGIPVSRIHLLPNGIDGSKYSYTDIARKQRLKKELNIQTQNLIINVSILRKQKNHRLLIDAWGKLPAEMREKSVLAVVGDGPLLKQLIEYTELKKLSDSIYFMGQMSDVIPWYQAADLYVISSDHEGLSNSMIEALASGLPVISTKVSGSSIISTPIEAGILVDTENEYQLTTAMKSLISDTSKREIFSINARNIFETNFSIDTISKRMHTLYNETISGH